MDLVTGSSPFDTSFSLCVHPIERTKESAASPSTIRPRPSVPPSPRCTSQPTPIPYLPPTPPNPAHHTKYQLLVAPPSTHLSSHTPSTPSLKKPYAAFASTSARFANKIPRHPPSTYGPPTPTRARYGHAGREATAGGVEGCRSVEGSLRKGMVLWAGGVLGDEEAGGCAAEGDDACAWPCTCTCGAKKASHSSFTNARGRRYALGGARGSMCMP